MYTLHYRERAGAPHKIDCVRVYVFVCTLVGENIAAINAQIFMRHLTWVSVPL